MRRSLLVVMGMIAISGCASSLEPARQAAVLAAEWLRANGAS